FTLSFLYFQKKYHNPKISLLTTKKIGTFTGFISFKDALSMTLRDYAEKPDKSSRPPARKNTLSQSDEVMSAGLSDPSLATPQKLMQLQRTLGNQAVMRFLAQQDSQSATDSATSIRRYTERTATNPEMQEWVSKFQRSSANGG